MQLPTFEDGKMFIVLHDLHRAGVVNYLLLLMAAALELIGFGVVLHAHFLPLDSPTKKTPRTENTEQTED